LLHNNQLLDCKQSLMYFHHHNNPTCKSCSIRITSVIPLNSCTLVCWHTYQPISSVHWWLMTYQVCHYFNKSN